MRSASTCRAVTLVVVLALTSDDTLRAEPPTKPTVFRGHANWIFSIAFTPDGKQLVSGDRDGTIKVWDIDKGKELATFSGHDRAVWAIAISTDGKVLASGSEDKTVKLWDLEKRKELRTIAG